MSPIALQGPKAEVVAAQVMGDWVRGLRYFWFRETEIAGIPVAVQRFGWSKQGGFETYRKDGTRGTELWNIFKEAGQPWGIGPGAPATAERTESGLVSVGGDTDNPTNPFDVRMGEYVDHDLPDDVVGIQALRKIKAAGSQRHQLGLVPDGVALSPLGLRREDNSRNGQRIGMMTNCVWSPRMRANIGYALIDATVPVGDSVQLLRDHGSVSAKLIDLPFL